MIIVVSSRSGGVGKSTTAQHLAAYLAQRRGAGSVALVDADNNETCLDWAARGDGQRFEVLSSEADGLDQYDHLIIDTAAAPDSGELGGLLAEADLLLIPTTPSAADLSPAIATHQGLEADGVEALFLLTLCAPRPSKRAEQTLQAMRSAELPVLSQSITRRECYLDAISTGQHVGQLKGISASKSWEEWKALGREVFKRRL